MYIAVCLPLCTLVLFNCLTALCPEMLTLLAKSTQVCCLLAWAGLANRKHRGEIKVWEEREAKVFILLVPFLLDPGLTLAVFLT